MGTTIRSELSKKNRYHISKHRQLELKHFCLQYDEWKQSLRDMDGYMGRTSSLCKAADTNDISDEVSRLAEKREQYLENIKLIDDAARMTDPVIGKYLITGVTSEVSYEVLCARGTVPCCKEVYYNLYRKFFWILDKVRK